MKTSNLIQRVVTLVIISMFIVVSSLSAQDSFTIKGRILNSVKKPVKFASAQLVNPSTQEVVAKVECDEDGYFWMSEIEHGEYILTATKDGFTQAESRRISIDRNGKFKTLGIVMVNPQQAKDELIATK